MNVGYLLEVVLEVQPQREIRFIHGQGSRSLDVSFLNKLQTGLDGSERVSQVGTQLLLIDIVGDDFEMAG